MSNSHSTKDVMESFRKEIQDFGLAIKNHVIAIREMQNAITSYYLNNLNKHPELYNAEQTKFVTDMQNRQEKLIKEAENNSIKIQEMISKYNTMIMISNAYESIKPKEEQTSYKPFRRF